MWVQRDWPGQGRLKGPKNVLPKWSSQKMLDVWLSSWGLSAGMLSSIQREGWLAMLDTNAAIPAETSGDHLNFVGIFLQVLGAPFLLFPGAVLTLPKTWSISHSWSSLESLQDPSAERGCRRGHPPAGFLQDCGSPAGLDGSLLINSC